MSQRHWIQSGPCTLITIVAHGRAPMFQNDAYAREAIEALYRVRVLHPFQLFGFIFMPDHCHMLVKVRYPLTISRVVNIYKTTCYDSFGIAKIWQQRFHLRLVTHPRQTLRYIHQNPVRAGLVVHARDYPWSSASGRWNVDDLGIGDMYLAK